MLAGSSSLSSTPPPVPPPHDDDEDSDDEARLARAEPLSRAFSLVPEDAMDRACSFVRKADGQPHVSERLEFLEEAGQCIQQMRAPSETRAFDLQRCDPQHHKQPYLIMIRVELRDEDARSEVKRAMGMAEGDLIPETAHMLVVTWYYALFLKRGTGHAEEWRMPGGYVFPHDGGECLGWCPANVVAVKPRFPMNMNTLNILMNIRDHARKMAGESTPFDTRRSLTACAKDVPRSKASNKRVRTDGEEGRTDGEEDGADPVVEEVAGVRRSGRVVTQRTLQIPEASTFSMGRPSRGRRRGGGGKLPAHLQRMIEFGVKCWERYGQGKDYTKKKDFESVFDKVSTLPPQSDHSDGDGGGDSSSSSSSDSDSDGDGGGARGMGDGREDGGTSSPSLATHASPGAHGAQVAGENLKGHLLAAIDQVVDGGKAKLTVPYLISFLNAVAEGGVCPDDLRPIMVKNFA